MILFCSLFVCTHIAWFEKLITIKIPRKQSQTWIKRKWKIIRNGNLQFVVGNEIAYCSMTAPFFGPSLKMLEWMWIFHNSAAEVLNKIAISRGPNTPIFNFDAQTSIWEATFLFWTFIGQHCLSFLKLKTKNWQILED